MKIKLYLKNINQEMIDAGRKIIGNRIGSDTSWVVSWPKSCCVLDFAIPIPGEEIINPLRGYVMRAEKEGGMMWDPKSGSVYKLDEEAYHALLELDQGFSSVEVAKRIGVSPESINSLTKTISRLKVGNV